MKNTEEYYNTENIVLDGKRTSIRLETPFWEGLATISEVTDKTVLEIYDEVYHMESPGNFASKLRSYIVEQLNVTLRSKILAAKVIKRFSENEYKDFKDPGTLGARITTAREALSLSQKELAHKLGVQESTLISWENELVEPRANKLSMIAGLLNVSPIWLLYGERKEANNPQKLSYKNKF